MIECGMKGAAGSMRQLHDRAERLTRLGLPVIIELHTFGPGDLYDERDFAASAAVVARLRGQYPARLFVHVPYQQLAVVLTKPFDRDQVLRTVEFAHAVDAEGIVIHRYFGLVRGGEAVEIPRAEAEQRFEHEVVQISRALDGRLGFVENLGFFWLRPTSTTRYLTSALDHFFPWEAARFRRFLHLEQILNVHPMVDVAHATLSANMYNALRSHPGRFRDDPRFQGITDDDLERVAWLSPYDFLAVQPPYLHVSDAIYLSQDEIGGLPEQPEARAAELINTAATSEALPLGAGNLDITAVLRQLAGQPGPHPLVIAEIDPSDGQSHDANAAQEAAVRQFVELAASIDADRFPRSRGRYIPG